MKEKLTATEPILTLFLVNNLSGYEKSRTELYGLLYVDCKESILNMSDDNYTKFYVMKRNMKR